jgi:uncharacterized protein YukE
VYPGPNAPVNGDPTGPAAGHLAYLSQVAARLGVADPVRTYLTPVVGSWRELRAEAARWRAAAVVADDVTHRLSAPLGSLDAAWQGADANSFLDYMHQVGLAGTDLSDSLAAMAEALERVEDGVRQIIGELVDLLADTAQQLSDALSVPVSGQSRAAGHLGSVEQPARELYESVRDVIEAFVGLCDDASGASPDDHLVPAHVMPAQAWSPPNPVPVASPPAQPAAVSPVAAPAAAVPVAAPVPAGPPPVTQPAATPLAAAFHAPAAGGGALGAGFGTHALPGSGDLAAQSGPSTVSGAMPDSGQTQPQQVPGSEGASTAAANQGQPMGGGMMGGMGGGMGRQGGGDTEHKPKVRLSGDIRDILGKPERTTPPVIGED